MASNRLASHTAPVQYFFGTLSDDGAFDAIDRRVSEHLMHALVEFTKTGVPTCASGQAWPPFDAARPRQALVTDTIALSTYDVTPLLRAVNSLRAEE